MPSYRRIFAIRQLLFAVLTLSAWLPGLAQISLNAQYQWVDQSGQMVFSDQPPPASVPLSRILRVGDPVAEPTRSAQQDKPVGTPLSPEPLSPEREVSQAPDASASASESGRPSLTEQMVGFEKRRAERKEKRRKRAMQAKLAKANAKSCERMQADKHKLESGIRVRSRNKAGALVFLTETERFAQARALAKRLKKCQT